MVLNFIKEINRFKKYGEAYKARQEKNYYHHTFYIKLFYLMKYQFKFLENQIN
jgi:hypothetical protein